MSKIEIITDPSMEVVDVDFEKADVITVIHSGKEKDVRDLLDKHLNKEFKPVYCHYYTDDKTYTIGLKVITL